MARARKPGDTSHNARRRYIRKAKRLVERAATKVGSTKSRLLIQAADLVSDALSLYESPSKIGQTVRDFAQSLGIDVDKTKKTTNKLEVVAESYNELESAKLDPVAKKDREAKALLRHGNIKNRFYGGLVDIWEGASTREERNELIKAHFGAESILDVMRELESVVNLYKAPTNEEYYEDAKLKIAEYVA